MSSLIQEEVKCPCGAVFEAEIYQSISVKEDPDLKDSLLGGQFNVVQCPTCRQMVYAEHFVLYHDSAQELLAFVYPKGLESQTEQIQIAMSDAFKQMQAGTPLDQQIRYQPFLLFGLDSLCDLLNIEDEISDELKIVQALSEAMDMPYRKIHFDSARRNNIPALLPIDAPLTPGKKQKPAAAAAASGIKKILASNPHLVHYQRFLKKIEGGWFLADSDFA